MGVADCINVDLDKILQKSSTHQGPLPDTMQAGACNFPPFPMFICLTNFGSQSKALSSFCDLVWQEGGKKNHHIEN